MSTLYYKNDNDLHITGLRKASDGSFINDATITADLYDENDEIISGASSISLAYESGSDGNYRGTVAGTVQLTVGTQVKAIVESSNYNLYWEKFFDVEKRSS